MIDSSYNIRATLKESLRNEIEPDGKGGYFRPNTHNRDLSSKSFSDRFGFQQREETTPSVLEWSAGGARDKQTHSDLELREQIEISFRSHEGIAAEIHRIMGLTSNCRVEITKTPKPEDEYQEIRGFVVIHNQFLEKAQLPFAIDIPLTHAREFWLGGVTIKPVDSPGLAGALLNAVSQERNQSIVFVDRYGKNEYVVATSQWLSTEFEAPYHLYRVVFNGNRSLVRKLESQSYDEVVECIGARGDELWHTEMRREEEE